MMKLFKLHTHMKNCNHDLILNPREHPDAEIGKIVEIYHPEDEGVRLLLQITCFNDEVKGRETISVESNIAAAFKMRNYGDVIVRIVDPQSVALDSVEITFKDQYMGRSEMWRLKSHLVNTCVYTNKKIEFCKGDIRCQVYEMWSQGDRVACGVITADTKVVFRSSTSMVYLFIQMSSEMWDFDIHGDLYYEKAVNGFLTDLFLKWKKLGCNHEVTIVLFSRTFYAATSLDEFPLRMRDCLQLDYKGRFYEDFYRVAIQNERCDDWSTVLVQLRRLFTSYQNTVLKYHDRGDGEVIPPATNSTAAKGNFLEVLNIALNAFEKHYLDRSFDRTGQLSVVITPGVGVFEVDRELTNVTKQRVIDNGVGSDLVCVGEQPLHAVPLLKFHNKDSSQTAADDYSMPHWINLSFYSTNKKIAYSKFIPRIKLPPLLTDAQQTEEAKENANLRFISDNQTECIHNSLFDYDEYDAHIFQLPTVATIQRSPRSKKTSVPSLDGYVPSQMSLVGSNEWAATASTPPPQRTFRRKLSDPDILGTASGAPRNASVSLIMSQNNSPNSTYSGSFVSEHKFGRRSIASNGATVSRPGRALINPFDPSHVTIKLTSNRRRWTHIFPKGPTGVLIQQHHYQAVPTAPTQVKGRKQDELPSSMVACAIAEDTKNYVGVVDKLLSEAEYGRKPAILQAPSGASVEPSKSLTLIWGATGEQEWTPALTTELQPGKIVIGVDWKSLTIPACLPITTDYFPDKRSLHNDYVVSNYTLLPEDVNADFAESRAVYLKPLSTQEVFRELISQRLAQGFQLILLNTEDVTMANRSPLKGDDPPLNSQPMPRAGHRSDVSVPPVSILKAKPPPQEQVTEYKLSIGRTFHKIALMGDTITVTRYRPRHPYPLINVDYRYRFHAPQHDTYEVSGVNFTTEKLENYNWNAMDHYICTRGDVESKLTENLKYWRYRMYLLPKEHPAMKKILEGKTNRCDIFTEVPLNETPKQQIDDFLRYVEMYLNRIKRTIAKKPRHARHLERHLSLSRVPKVLPSRISTESTFLGLNDPIDDTDDVLATELKLKPNASLLEIYEAMKHPVTGVSFLGPATSIPAFTFVSYDAVVWLQSHIDGPCDAVEILERMRADKLICHASGDKTKAIVVGFVLYFITKQNRDAKDYVPPLCNLQTFENEWMEVEVRIPEGGSHDANATEAQVPKFLCNVLRRAPVDDPLYKQSHLEVDINQKSDRIEWGHARYHRVMTPGHAFEFVVQWVTASGPIVFELINGWCRKATQYSCFHFVPIPADPLAEPFTEKSDPLRGPIFVPLNVDCLKEGPQAVLFDEFDEASRPQRLLLFQEAILARFGFMPCAVETRIGSNQTSLDSQYVHCSGNMFILIPSITDGLRARRRHHLSESNASAVGSVVANGKASLFGNNTAVGGGGASTSGSFITRHVSGKNKEECDNVWVIGFLWSWNHMIANKRWKSLVINNSPDGEIVQLRMLRDFKAFCANQENRLKHFWDDCWAQKYKVQSQ